MKPGLRKRTSLTRRRSRGQSVVLIALILAVLIGLVALSVDVGNTYAQQRAAQRATDAASTDAMTLLLSGAKCPAIDTRIRLSLQAHGVTVHTDPNTPPAPGERSYEVSLIQADKDATPKPMSACDATVLAGTRYIKVTLTGTEPTNFATLFGRPDLPVNADAFAQRTICPPEPIGLSTDAFKGWAKEGDETDTTYSDDVYKSPRPMRRFFLHTDPRTEASGGANTTSYDALGQFAWLRWTDNGTSAQALATALKPPGSLNQGFQEVEPWDNDIFGATPDVYPTQKGLLNKFDLVHGAPTMNLGAGYKQGGSNGLNGASGDDGVGSPAEQLRWLIDNHVAFNLPLYDVADHGIGSNAVYRILDFKSYMLVGYGYISDSAPGQPTAPNRDRGYGWFLDLVQLGKPLECAQSDTEPTLPTQKVTLAGTVNVRPVYQQGGNGSTPTDIVVVLDASGSMNWDWDGTGSVSSQTASDLKKYADSNGNILCASTKVLQLNVGCQSSEAYKDYKQRKLYQAKQTLKKFLLLNWGANDRVAIVTYNGGYNVGTGPTDGLTKVYPQATRALTKDFNGLADEMINDAASMNPASTDQSALYTTLGGSPGALALKKANQVLSTSSGTRRRVVVFLTDGLLNVYLNGHRNADESINANYDRSETVKPPLPTNEAITQAKLIKSQANSAEIYVIALGKQFSKSGLDQVATKALSPYLTTAGSSGELDKVFSDIKKDIDDPTCIPGQEADQIPDVNRTMHYSTANGFQPETDPVTGQPSAGKVTVKLNGVKLDTTFNIGPDGTFRIPNLLPNTDYTLTFNNPADPDNQPVFYMGKDTPDSIPRNYSIVAGTGSPELTVHIKDASISTTQFVYDNSPIILLLNGTGACSTPN